MANSVWMYLCYVDESGNTGTNLLDASQPIYLIGGVAVDDGAWKTAHGDMKAVLGDAAKMLRAAVPELIEKDPEVRRKWSRLLLPGVKKQLWPTYAVDELIGLLDSFFASGRFEIHGAEICPGTGAFFRIASKSCVEIIHHAIDVLAKNDLPFLLARLDKQRHHRRYGNRAHPADEVTMVAFTEAFEKFLKAKTARGLIIADRVEDPRKVKERLQRYQDQGTPYPAGGPIQHVIDSVHFVESHMSPLTQLADLCTYFASHDQRSTGAWKTEWSRIARLCEPIKSFN